VFTRDSSCLSVARMIWRVLCSHNVSVTVQESFWSISQSNSRDFARQTGNLQHRKAIICSASASMHTLTNILNWLHITLSPIHFKLVWYVCICPYQWPIEQQHSSQLVAGVSCLQPHRTRWHYSSRHYKTHSTTTGMLLLNLLPCRVALFVS